MLSLKFRRSKLHPVFFFVNGCNIDSLSLGTGDSVEGIVAENLMEEKFDLGYEQYDSPLGYHLAY